MTQYRKKIFDIVPPKEAERIKAVILPSSQTEERREKKEEKKRRFLFSGDRFPKKGIGFFAVVVFMFLLVFGVYSRFREARVAIHPVLEQWNLQEEIVASPIFSDIDISAKTIPGFLIESQKELSQQFQATGKTTKEAKAQGVIRVYNKYQLPQVLVANTRFLSDGGKLFRSKSRIVVPAGGFQDVPVEAAEPGESFNIGPSTFSIPGLAGTPRYTMVYGESKAPMTGGSLSETSEVTEDDIQKAKDSLSATLLQEGKKDLLAKIQEKGGDMVLLEGAFSQELEGPESLVNKGAQVAYFQVKGNVHSKALVIQRKTLEEFWKQASVWQLPEGKVVAPNTLKIEFSLKSIDWEQKRLTIQSSASVSVYTKLDLENFRDRLRGMSPKQGREFLKGFPAIEKADVKIWPLPIGNIPTDTNKVKMLLLLD
jgi:hypothetical protein